MKITYNINDIDPVAWENLIQSSPTATWFQTREAYNFFASLSFLEPFVVAVMGSLTPNPSPSGEGSRMQLPPQVTTPLSSRRGAGGEATLKGLIVGYIQKNGGKLKQYFSRRAIITGGPLLTNDIKDEELSTLLNATIKHLRKKAIYIETRNLNDYSLWRKTFEDNGFKYEPHLNFHVNTESVEGAQSNIGKHRWKYIRISLRDGANLVENPSLEQIKKFYTILQELYRTKVKMPLFPFEFFEKLTSINSAHFLLVEHEGEIIGGSLCVCLKGRTVYEWVKCGDEHYLKNIRPSSVATWLGIKYSAENGCPRYDFMGAGKPNEPYGVRNFKAEFGGKLVEHGRYLHVCKPLLYNMGKLAVKILKKL